MTVYVGGTDVITVVLDEYDATDTVVTISLVGPGGQIITPTASSADGRRTWQAVPSYDEAGRWVATVEVAGTGANVWAHVVQVTAFPAAATAVAWRPTLEEVADHISRFTIDVVTPGSAVELGTFTSETAPTNTQADRLIDSAMSTVAASLGSVVVAAQPLARVVAALRAAAMIARSFNRSSSDLTLADSLDRRADSEMKRLVTVNIGDVEGDTADDVLPLFVFPGAVAWGDLYL